MEREREREHQSRRRDSHEKKALSLEMTKRWRESFKKTIWGGHSSSSKKAKSKKKESKMPHIPLA